MSLARTACRRSAPGHVIRVGGAIALFPLLREHGINPEALAAEAGLSAEVFANPDNVVPFVALCRLTHLARERTGLCDLGLRACTNTGLAALGLLGYLVANSASVGRGLAALQEFLQVHDEGATAYFASEGDSAVLGYEVLTPGVPGADQLTFGALAIAANVLRSLCGAGFRFHEVNFAYRAPPDVSLFRSFFGAPVRFDAERSALAFEARWLAAPVAGADAFIRDILVVDEVGYLTYGTDAANMLFHVVNDRHKRRRSMIFTTNKPLKAWGAVLHDEDLAHAIVDRILERGRVLHLDGPSMRTKHLGLDDLSTEGVSPQVAGISGILRPEFPEPTTARASISCWTRRASSPPGTCCRAPSTHRGDCRETRLFGHRRLHGERSADGHRAPHRPGGVAVI